MSADLLSELLAPLRLHGVFHSRWSARAPWGVAGERESCALLHYVQDGACVVELPGAAPVRVRAGELAVFPHGTAHRLADAPGRATVPLAAVLPERVPGATRTVRIDGPGAVTTLLCGGLHYDAAAAAPLYRALPRLLVLDAAAIAGEPLLGDLLHRLSQAGGEGAGEPGLALVALRTFELAFVLALRAALAHLADGEPVLRALRHPGVAAALLAVQNRFAEPWTVETLAAEAGMSRSAFAATFRELVGQAPMRHLTARRMQEAARLLGDTGLPHSAIAQRVGYQSTVGFHLAFRQWYGTTPGEHRKAG
ncbi:AraC family transcriptional regulator [Nonomuraea sp. NN258]|uniref:AraC family transcriptional regulator n=1 Tax=Nonomuraea antri TaxID=2730852 RepID=UPI0015694038|nr:AraC family transcriptional regulator [Nonomuraea antri]NRQ36144.1 AraC family transcriptional regulator [Nonomuraea antri]